MNTLHFIMDPQCGWCYAAAPLIDVLTELTELSIKIHSGGLFSGVNKGPVTSEFHQQMKESDKRIMALTGQQFSNNYYSTLFAEKDRVLDSDTPISALLAAEFLGIQPLTMLHTMQKAQFIDGRSMSDINNLSLIATELGAETKSFLNALAYFFGNKTNQHIAKTRQLMRALGGKGFPFFVLAHKDGSLTPLDHSGFYSTPELWSAYVKQKLQNNS